MGKLITDKTDFEVHAPLSIWESVAKLSHEIVKDSMGAKTSAVVKLLKVKLEHVFSGWGVDVTLYDDSDPRKTPVEEPWIAVMVWRR